jgi:hypothetical protein
MSFFGASSTSMGRRGLLRSAGYLTAAAIVVSPGMAFAGGGIVDVTAAPYGASAGLADNSAAFQAALNAIAKNGGGRLYVPGGMYVLQSPLSYSGGSLTIEGDGQNSSVLVNTHSGTVLAVSFGDTSKCLTVKEVGFSPCSGALAQAAIAVALPAQASGWQNVVIEDVCIGVPCAESTGQYTAYTTAISLTNTTRARINNVNVHANGLPGGIAVALNGTCYDTRVLGSTIEGYLYGVSVLSYCEGLHLANNVIICGTAVHTGTTNYNPGALAINLLELLMSDCEINTNSECLHLYQVKNAQISNCHFTGPKAAGGGIAINMLGCTESLVSNSTFCSSWGPGGAVTIGIAFMPSARIPTTSCHASDVQFENTAIGIYFGAGALSNTATNVLQLSVGAGGLVNGGTGYGSQTQLAYCDASGNASNNASWLTTTNTISAFTGRRSSSQH